ncbi:hypothetical protein ACH498_24970 [Rhodococcus erythropolis]
MKKISFLRRNTEAAAGMPLPEPVQLEDRVQAARDQVAQQHDPALVEALSARELAANRALAERIRDAERREQLARIEAAEAAAERVRRTAAALADREADDLIRAGRAIAEQRHTSSPHAKVARLHRRKTLVLSILTGVVGFAMLFSAVTVQHNIAPTGGVGNLMWWLSYGLETLISGMLVALMLSTSDTAEWGAIEEPWKVNAIEAVLLALTVTLNVFPYWKDGDWYNVGVHSIAPITIGAALATHSVVAGRYGQAIERATAAVPEHEDLQARLAALTNIGGRIDPVLHSAHAEDGAKQRSVYRFADRVSEHPAEHMLSTAAPVEHSVEHSAEQAPEQRSTALQSSAADNSPHPPSGIALTEQSTTSMAAEQPAPADTGRVGDAAPAASMQATQTSDMVSTGHGAAVSQASTPTNPELSNPEVGSVEQENSHTELQSAPSEQVAPEQSSTAPEHSAEQSQRSVEHMLSAPISAARPAEQAVKHVQSTPAPVEHPAQHGAEQQSAVHQPAPERRSVTEQQELAVAVRDLTRSRLPLDRIDQVIKRHDTTGDGAARIARDLGMGFATAEKLLTAAAKIRADRGAQVIKFRKA